MGLIAPACALLLLTTLPAPADPPLPERNPRRHGAHRTAISVPPLPPSKPGREPPPDAVPVQPLNAPCGGALKDYAIVAERATPISQGECGREEVLTVTAAGTETAVPLAAPATLSCGMAIGLAKWIGEAVAPAARKHLDAELSGLPAGTSYACRNRNNQADAKLSEHAYANAFDLPGFELANGDYIPVAAHGGDTPEDRFLTEIRDAACGPFTTVLGPGSDEYHSDHFHFDAAERRNPYCR